MATYLTLVDNQRHHFVARIPHVLDLEANITPSRKPPPPVGTDAFVTAVDTGQIRDRLSAL
jgi:hypothetical protein